jgi:two-component system, OmpR family, response regulator
MRILLVEDDHDLRETLLQALSRHGYGVDTVGDGRAADTALLTGTYDLVVLDLGLPHADGMEVLRTLRNRQDSTPVLILTARAGVDERVLGLQSGADDYLSKPFALVELEARIEALIRRAGGGLTTLTYGPLELNLTGKAVSVNGEIQEFTPREMAILEALISRVGQVVQKKRLAQQFGDWNSEVGTATIEVYIHRLRKRLTPLGVKIHTIHGLGYLLKPFEIY